MAYISHSKAFKAQGDFALDSKIVVGHDIWTEGTAGSRLYAKVLSKQPGSIGNAIALAEKLEHPFTPKATMGHLKWIFTAGELEVNGKSFPVAAKVTKPAKPEAAKVDPPKVEAKPEPKPEPTKTEKPKAKFKAKAKVMAARKQVHVKTRKVA